MFCYVITTQKVIIVITLYSVFQSYKQKDFPVVHLPVTSHIHALVPGYYVGKLHNDCWCGKQ